MATEAEATREAKAKVISAEGEQQASVALKEAADVISQSPVALQLRYLQTLTNVAAEKNSTIIFPIPIEMLSQFAKDGNKRSEPRSIHSIERHIEHKPSVRRAYNTSPEQRISSTSDRKKSTNSPEHVISSSSVRY